MTSNLGWRRALPLLKQCLNDEPYKAVAKDKYTSMQRLQLFRDGGAEVSYEERRWFKTDNGFVRIRYRRDLKRMLFRVHVDILRGVELTRLQLVRSMRWTGNINRQNDGIDLDRGVVITNMDFDIRRNNCKF